MRHEPAGLEWNPADVFDEGNAMEKSRSSRIMAYGFSVEDDEQEGQVTTTSALGVHYYFMLKVVQSFRSISRIQVTLCPPPKSRYKFRGRGLGGRGEG